MRSVIKKWVDVRMTTTILGMNFFPAFSVAHQPSDPPAPSPRSGGKKGRKIWKAKDKGKGRRPVVAETVDQSSKHSGRRKGKKGLRTDPNH